MVVGLLAMLFVILTTYMAVARSDQQISRSVAAGDESEEMLDQAIDPGALQRGRVGA